MNLLLDSHALLWWLAGESMDDRAVERIADPETVVAVSAASLWELAIKASIGKLTVARPLAPVVDAQGFRPLPVTLEHAEAVAGLPLHHRDPFDRMLVAQAQIENLTIVTRDPAFAAYRVAVLPC